MMTFANGSIEVEKVETTGAAMYSVRLLAPARHRFARLLGARIDSLEPIPMGPDELAALLQFAGRRAAA